MPSYCTTYFLMQLIFKGNSNRHFMLPVIQMALWTQTVSKQLSTQVISLKLCSQSIIKNLWFLLLHGSHYFLNSSNMVSCYDFDSICMIIIRVNILDQWWVQELYESRMHFKEAENPRFNHNHVMPAMRAIEVVKNYAAQPVLYKYSTH